MTLNTAIITKLFWSRVDVNANAATRLNLIVNTAIIPELFWSKVDMIVNTAIIPCLLYTSDAADES